MNANPEKRANSRAPMLETRVWLRMLACSSLIEGQLRIRLREEFDTTLARFDVLTQILRPPMEPTMGDLSRRLKVTKGNITDVVGRLEEEGLVRRTRDPGDARVQRVHLTSRGRQAVEAMIPVHNQRLAEVLRGVDVDDLKALDALLGRVRASLRDSLGA